jgi:membrane peptidoglycan carboxypeptidase
MIENTTNTGAGSVIYDSQDSLEGYPCTNKTLPPPKGQGNCLWDYDFRYPGPITLRYALGGSRNVPAVKAMLTVGTAKVISTAKSMGLTSGYRCFYDEQQTREKPCYGSSAIGDEAYLRLDEHVNGYGTLSRLGAYIPKTYILRIVDANSKTLEEWKQPKPKQVIRQDTAFIIDDILSDPNASYLPASYKAHRYKGWNFGFKTGTTNDAKDGLMMGMSTQYAAGVWVGYHTRQKAMTSSMEYMTEPILKGWLNAAHDSLMSAGAKPVNWTKPSDIKTLPAFIIRAKVSNLGEIIPSPANDIFPSWYQQSKQGGNVATVIDKVSKKKATSCTPELAKENTTTSNDNTFSADRFHGARGSATSTTEDDDVHKCDDTKPLITLTAEPACTVNSVCTFRVVVTQGTHALSGGDFPGTVNLLVNGNKIQSQGVNDSGSTLTFNYTPTSTGSITVTAQVIDSVLYSSSDEKTVDVSQGGSTGDNGNGQDNPGGNTGTTQ